MPLRVTRRGAHGRAGGGRHLDPWIASGLLVALVGRLVVVLVSPHYRPLFDASDYFRHGTAIGVLHRYPISWLNPAGGPTAFRPPLYPFLLGGLYLVFGAAHGVLVGRLAGAILGTVTVGIIGVLAAMLWGRRPARWAVLIAALWPPLLFLNAALMTESLFVALEMAVVLTALLARSRASWRWAVACGVCCGLAALTRSNGVLLAIPAAAGIWVGRPRLSARALAAPAALLLAMVLTLAPWTIRNAVSFHRFVPIDTQTGYGMAGYFNDTSRTQPGYVGLWSGPQDSARYRAIFNRPHQDEAQLDDALRSSAVSYALHHPGYIFGGAALNLVRMLGVAPNPHRAAEVDTIELGLSGTTSRIVNWTFFVGLAVSALGVLALRRRARGDRGPVFMWVVPLVMLVAAAWLIGVSRYRAPMYPFMVLLMGVAISDLVTRERD